MGKTKRDKILKGDLWLCNQLPTIFLFVLFLKRHVKEKELLIKIGV
jgi:hypothetical protein